jgi:hypothetical protein
MKDGQSWGPACSISLRTKCESRRRAEMFGEARRDYWRGFLFPISDPENPPLFGWSFCPWCNGEIREGLRTEILRAPDLTSTEEGEE